MTLLDAYALIAFVAGGPAAPRVRSILRDGDAAVCTMNLAETLDVSQRRYKVPISLAMEILDPLLDGPISPLPLDVATARRAAEIRSENYHRSSRPLSLADAVLIASASDRDRIATADPHVLTVAKTRGIKTVGLPEQG